MVIPAKAGIQMKFGPIWIPDRAMHVRNDSPK